MIECPRCRHRDFIVPYTTVRVERVAGWRALLAALLARMPWQQRASGGLLTCAACLHQFGYNAEGNYALKRGRERPEEPAAPPTRERNGPRDRLITPDQSWSRSEEET